MLIAARNAILADGAAPGPTPAYWGLCFTAEQANSTVAMVANGSAPSVNLLYSTDAANWSPFVVGTTTVTLASVGDQVWLKAGSGGNTRIGSGAIRYNTFSLSGQIAASGNIMSLLDGDNESLKIPAAYCFYGLFLNCASLTAAPELPAETLTTRCYGKMFQACTSLTAAPELPAATLGTGSYQDMFRACTSLTAVEIQATSLANSSLGTCFAECSSLITIKVHFKQFTGENMANWVRDVAATGTFYCPTALGTNATITRGVSACPEGWTVINTDA